MQWIFSFCQTKALGLVCVEMVVKKAPKGLFFYSKYMAQLGWRRSNFIFFRLSINWKYVGLMGLTLGTIFLSLPLLALHREQAQQVFSNVVLPPKLTGSTWSNVADLPVTESPQYWQVYASRRNTFCLENRTPVFFFWYSLRIMTAGTRVSQVALCTTQSSYHSSTMALSDTRYRMDSSQVITLRGRRLIGLASAFKIRVEDTG